MTGVIGNSPAAKAKLRAGDIITHTNGAKIENLNLFRYLINKNGPGDKVVLDTIKRWDGGNGKVEVKLGNRNDFIPAKQPPKLGNG